MLEPRIGVKAVGYQMVSEVVEVELASIAGSDDVSRLLFIMRTVRNENSYLLKRQTFSPNVGWFDQSEIQMSHSEMVAMRSALGVPAGKSTNIRGRYDSEGRAPAILKFPSPPAAAAS